jgi:hypothetical protein
VEAKLHGEGIEVAWLGPCEALGVDEAHGPVCGEHNIIDRRAKVMVYHCQCSPTRPKRPIKRPLNGKR